jgi:hypothetical protein
MDSEKDKEEVRHLLKGLKKIQKDNPGRKIGDLLLEATDKQGVEKTTEDIKKIADMEE